MTHISTPSKSQTLIFFFKCVYHKHSHGLQDSKYRQDIVTSTHTAYKTQNIDKTLSHISTPSKSQTFLNIKKNKMCVSQALTRLTRLKISTRHCDSHKHTIKKSDLLEHSKQKMHHKHSHGFQDSKYRQDIMTHMSTPSEIRVFLKMPITHLGVKQLVHLLVNKSLQL